MSNSEGEKVTREKIESEDWVTLSHIVLSILMMQNDKILVFAFSFSFELNLSVRQSGFTLYRKYKPSADDENKLKVCTF